MVMVKILLLHCLRAHVVRRYHRDFIVFIEKCPLDLHWSIVKLDLPSWGSSMVVSVVLLRPVVMRCVAVLVVMLREIVDGRR